MYSADLNELASLMLVSLASTDRLGELLWQKLPDATCLGLVGTLGAGKTRLAQSIISAAGVDRSEVLSPTFALDRLYHVDQREIHHLDAYRIADVDEFWELGIEEFVGRPATLTLIEWADRVMTALPPETLWIELHPLSDEQRCVKLWGRSPHWHAWTEELRSSFTS